MSFTDDVKGKFDELTGKAQKHAGEAAGDESTANKGAAKEIKGQAEQTWGTVKDAANDKYNDLKEQHKDDGENTGHDIREKLTSTAQNVKEGVANFFHKDDEKK